MQEGIRWTPIEYFNNKIVCDLIESKIVSAESEIGFLALPSHRQDMSRVLLTAFYTSNKTQQCAKLIHLQPHRPPFFSHDWQSDGLKQANALPNLICLSRVEVHPGTPRQGKPLSSCSSVTAEPGFKRSSYLSVCGFLGKLAC